MDGEDKLELVIISIIMILDIIVCFSGNFLYYSIPIITANIIFILFYVIPTIKRYKEKLNIKKKSNFVEGKIYDIIKCYEMIYLYDDEMPEVREYPVVIFQNDKGQWEKIIADESDPDEYKIGDYVDIWYRYGRKEKIQISENTFLTKSYKKINIVENEITKIDNTFLEDEITIYNKNRNAKLSEYKNTLIMNGKNLIIRKKRKL